jgi:hypothetical protein
MDGQNLEEVTWFEDFLLRLKECRVAEDWECAICTDRAPTEDQGQGGDGTKISKILEIGDVPVETPDCHHVFHHSCLYTWAVGDQENHFTCPMCRTELFDESCNEEYMLTAEFVINDAPGDDSDDDSDSETDENMYDGASEAGSDFDMDVDSNQEPEMTPDELTDAVAQILRELKDDFRKTRVGRYQEAQVRVLRVLESKLERYGYGILPPNWREAIHEGRLYGEYMTRSFGHECEEHVRAGDIWWEVFVAMDVVKENCSGTDWTWSPGKKRLQHYFLDLCDRYRSLRDAVED